MTSNKNLRVYACGGTGINIMSLFENLKGDNSSYATIENAFIDSSEANFRRKNIDPDKTFILDSISDDSKLQGAGKIRASIVPDAIKQIPGILNKFKPTEFNIVVHSGSGGTGSVLGPLIVSELKKLGLPVITLMVGSTDSLIESENTFKTLETYDNISKETKSSSVLFYTQNGIGRYEADEQINVTISSLAALFADNHDEMDYSDLKTWYNTATKVTPIPTISSLTIVRSKEALSKLDKIVSVASLATPAMDTRIEPTPSYQTTGFVDSSWTDTSLPLITDFPIHFILNFDLINGQYKNLKKIVEEGTNNISSQVHANSGFSISENSIKGPGGLVL